jgi:hypothetical protein
MIRVLIPGSRIQGSKRHRIPDPDPQHCFGDLFTILTERSMQDIKVERSRVIFTAIVIQEKFYRYRVTVYIGLSAL